MFNDFPPSGRRANEHLGAGILSCGDLLSRSRARHVHGDPTGKRFASGKNPGPEPLIDAQSLGCPLLSR
jgi:hypothetical protein